MLKLHIQADHLEVLLEPLGKQVCSYYGNQGGGALPKDTSVAVCTIEKANSLVNRLLEEGRLSELGIIVIDELHMVFTFFFFLKHTAQFHFSIAYRHFLLLSYKQQDSFFFVCLFNIQSI